jgi:hypothetical protein
VPAPGAFVGGHAGDVGRVSVPTLPALKVSPVEQRGEARRRLIGQARRGQLAKAQVAELHAPVVLDEADVARFAQEAWSLAQLLAVANRVQVGVHNALAVEGHLHAPTLAADVNRVPLSCGAHGAFGDRAQPVQCAARAAHVQRLIRRVVQNLHLHPVARRLEAERGADGNPVVRARAEAELHLQFEVAVSASAHQSSAPVASKMSTPCSIR